MRRIAVRALKLACAIALMSGAAGESEAAIVMNLSLEQLVEFSDLIATGRILSRHEGWNDSRTGVFTTYDLAITNCAKGDVPVGRVITLRFPGGNAGDLLVVVAGAPSFSPGDEVMLFMERGSHGYYSTIGWQLGCYVLDDDPATGQRFARQRGLSAGVAVSGVLDGTPLPARISLDELFRVIEEMTSAAREAESGGRGDD